MIKPRETTKLNVKDTKAINMSVGNLEVRDHALGKNKPGVRRANFGKVLNEEEAKQND